MVQITALRVGSIESPGIGCANTIGMWSPEHARDLAQELIGEMMPRWCHLSGVGQTAEQLAEWSSRVSEAVVVAAWLHDVGYAPRLATTGFHALDGARELTRRGAPSNVVALVGHDTGARYEAEQRGLIVEWRRLPEPDRESLDVLTMIDLSVGPSGEAVSARDRIVEIT